MNIFGINGGELIVLIVLALLLLGPEKIPQYLRTLREWIHKARVLAEGAKEQFKEETGTDFDDVDWKKYDPRQYDPRRVIREALAEPIEDLESTLTDAKSCLQDAADTAIENTPERPALTQAHTRAAAVPIDQHEQQEHSPDPPRSDDAEDSAAESVATDQAPAPLSNQPAAAEAERPAEEAEAAPSRAATVDDPTVVLTPFDAETTYVIPAVSFLIVVVVSMLSGQQCWSKTVRRQTEETHPTTGFR